MKKVWTKPTIQQWESAGEVREHFENKGSPAERAALEKALASVERLHPEAERVAPLKRRA